MNFQITGHIHFDVFMYGGPGYSSVEGVYHSPSFSTRKIGAIWGEICAFVGFYFFSFASYILCFQLKYPTVCSNRHVWYMCFYYLLYFFRCWDFNHTQGNFCKWYFDMIEYIFFCSIFWLNIDIFRTLKIYFENFDYVDCEIKVWKIN